MVSSSPLSTASVSLRLLPMARILSVAIATASAVTVFGPRGALWAMSPVIVWASLAGLLQRTRTIRNIWVIDLLVVLGARTLHTTSDYEAVMLLIAAPVCAGAFGRRSGVVVTFAASLTSFLLLPLPEQDHPAAAVSSALIMAGLASVGWLVTRSAALANERMSLAERRTDELRAVLGTVLHSDTRGVIVRDADDEIVDANVAAIALLEGWPEQHAVSEVAASSPLAIPGPSLAQPSDSHGDPLDTGHNGATSRTNSAAEACRSLVDSVRDSGVPSTNVVLRPTAPSDAWLAASVHPIEMPDGRWIVTFLSDVTAEIHAVSALEEASELDDLTGVGNRRNLERSIAALERTGGSVGVVLLDLDGFKAINDEHGHSVGDEVLCEVGVRLRLIARTGDIVTRLGGDEFVVLIPGSDRVATMRIADRIEQVLLAPYITTVGLVTIGCSLGAEAGRAASVRGHIHVADSRMYEHKRSRRRSADSTRSKAH